MKENILEILEAISISITMFERNEINKKKFLLEAHKLMQEIDKEVLENDKMGR